MLKEDTDPSDQSVDQNVDRSIDRHLARTVTGQDTVSRRGISTA